MRSWMVANYLSKLKRTMKKIFAILCATVALFSCSQGDLLETENTQDQTPQGAPVNFNITVEEQGTTKALKTAWVTGDVIYIKFREIDDKYLTITYNGTNWIAQAYNSTNAATTFVESDFIGLDDAKKSVGAVHFPVAVDATLSGSRLSFQKNSEAVKTYFLYQDGANYTVDGADVTLTLSLQKPTNMVLFHIPGIEANVSDYTLYIDKYPDNLVVRSCLYIENSSLSYTANSATYSGFQGFADENGAIFSVYFFNGHSIGEATTYTFTVKGPVQEYTISGSLTLQSGNQYRLPALNSGKWTKKYGEFSVGSTTKVYIAPGNLQATTTDLGATWTWAFAANQWDYIGNAGANTSINGNGTVSANGTVDLFGWVGASNSDWTGGAMYGISNSTYSSTYGNVIGESLKSDWSNTIGSGWRTPTIDEWYYLCKERESGATVNGTSNARHVYATINTDATEVNGMILFPDGVTISSSEATSWGSINGAGAFADATKCTSAQWNALATKGCVFLPTAGLRESGASVPSFQLEKGYYWSSSSSSTYGDRALDFKFGNNATVTSDFLSRYYGASVRLVHDVE